MRHKKNKFFRSTVSIIMVLSMLTGRLPLEFMNPVMVLAEATNSVVYTDFNASESGNGTKEAPYKYFVDALSAVSEGGTIIVGSGGAFVNEGGVSLAPLVIDKKVTIRGESTCDFSIRTAGIVLGADVTFENISLGFANRHNNAIFANGYTLTMTNVSQVSGTREVHLFAGGLQGSGVTKGTQGNIIIKGDKAQFGNIYAGSMNESSSLPASIIINGTSSMKIGEIYACGASTGYYDVNDLFSGVEPEAPLASVNNYPVSGEVAIELNDISIKNINGLASVGGNKADVALSTEYTRENMEFSNIDTLTVKSGVLIPKSLNEDVNIEIQEDGTLDLSAVTQQNNNSFSVNDFTGGGILRLGIDDVLYVKGRITNTTNFEISDPSVLNGSGLANEEYGYIDVSEAEGEGGFEFSPNIAQEGLELVKQDSIWTTTALEVTIKYMTSFDISDDIKTNGLTVTKEDIIGENASFPITGSVEEGGYINLGDVEFLYSVDYCGTTYEVETFYDGLGYVGNSQELNLCFVPMGEILGEECYDTSISVWSVDSNQSIKSGTYTITIQAPAEDGWITQEMELQIIGDDISQEQGKVTFEGGIHTYLEDEITTTYTYGDCITVKVTPTISIEALEIITNTQESVNQIALFVGDERITESQTVTSGSEVAFTIDTTQKQLEIGSNTITVKYTGNPDSVPVIPDYSENIDIILNQKPLSVSAATAKGREYDGTNIVEIETVTLSGICESDEVYVDNLALTGTISSEEPGNYQEVSLSTLTLSGRDVNNYSLIRPSQMVPLTQAISILEKEEQEPEEPTTEEATTEKPTTEKPTTPSRPTTPSQPTTEEVTTEEATTEEATTEEATTEEATTEEPSTPPQDEKPENGWYTDESGNQYFYQDGETISNQWYKAGDEWYYLNESGMMETGWIKDKEKWYYLDKDGTMETGWVKDENKWYYLDKDGAMETGWVKDEGKWYYLNQDGAMKTNWVKDNDKWYYLNQNGAMETGWIKDKDKWYYLHADGCMKTGWIKDKDKWYYLNQDGAMMTGWIKDKDKWYYLDKNGDMVTNTIIDGYKINHEGVWVE